MTSRICVFARLALLVACALCAAPATDVGAQVVPRDPEATAPLAEPAGLERDADGRPGRALAVEGLPALADDGGTRPGARLAHAAVDASGRAALLFAEPRAFVLHVGDLRAAADPRDPTEAPAAADPSHAATAPAAAPARSPFGPPRRVGTDAPLAMGSFWGPRVALDGERVVVVGVLVSKGGREGDVFAWTSDDAGASFAEPVRLNALEGAAQERLVELAVGSDGRLAVAWMHSEEGVVSLRGVSSRDLGASWSAERVLHASASGSVCPCCPPALAFARDSDELWMVFRDDVDGFRDNYLRRLDAPRAAPLRLGAPRWEISGCPMSVPALRVGVHGPVVAYRRHDALFEAELPAPHDAREAVPERAFAPEPGAPPQRWPLAAQLRDGDAAPVPLRLWRRGTTLKLRAPGAFLDTDLGAARRALLADTLDPAGPVLLAAELDDGAGGWRLALRLLQDVAR